jgi:hypothetical protein
MNRYEMSWANQISWEIYREANNQLAMEVTQEGVIMVVRTKVNQGCVKETLSSQRKQRVEHRETCYQGADPAYTAGSKDLDPELPRDLLLPGSKLRSCLQ